MAIISSVKELNLAMLNFQFHSRSRLIKMRIIVIPKYNVPLCFIRVGAFIRIKTVILVFS